METAATPTRRSSDLPDGEAGVTRGDDGPDPLVFGLVQPRRRQAQALVDLLVAQEALLACFSGAALAKTSFTSVWNEADRVWEISA